MKTKNKIIIIILVVVLLIFFYLFATAKKISFNDQSIKAEASTEVSREAYQEETVNILGDYLILQKENNLDLATVKQTKENLMNVIVPKEFKEIHMNLFLAMNKMEEFFENKNPDQKKESEEIINNELENIQQLNN